MKTCINCGIIFHGRDCKICASRSKKLYYQKNKEKEIQRVMEWQKNNPEYKQKAKQYREKNKEKIKQKIKEYYSNNKSKYIYAGHKRRALKKQSKNTLSKDIFEKLFVLQKGRCIVCNCKLSKDSPRSPIDHIIPLSKGGDNSDYNVQLLCLSCNSSKNDKDPIEFMQSRGYLL